MVLSKLFTSGAKQVITSVAKQDSKQQSSKLQFTGVQKCKLYAKLPMDQASTSIFEISDITWQPHLDPKLSKRFKCM